MTTYAARFETYPERTVIVLRGIEAERGDDATTKARRLIRDRGLTVYARPLVLPETPELVAYLDR